MQMYQNYSQPMNPYQNNYQPMPMQNPYMDRMAQLQNYQQSLQPTQMSGANQIQSQGIIGRVVNDFSEITANDVPMNGSAAFFPKADGSELQVRSWASNGTIQTVVYHPIQTENTEHATNIPQMDFNALNDGIMALGNNIMARIDELEQSWTNSSTKTSKPTTRTKKEVTADE